MGRNERDGDPFYQFSAQNILYEDNHLLVVLKPFNSLIQGDKSGDESLLELVKKYIKVRDNKSGNVFLGLVHRLDRPVAGVLLFAKTSKSLSRLNKNFRERSVRKEYLAILNASKGEGSEGENNSILKKRELVHYLRKNAKQNKSYPCSSSDKGAKRAVLEYSILGYSQRYLLLHIELKSGRHHQIRAQLSSIGLPIRGDLKYGSSRANPHKNIDLLAYRLTLEHPVTNKLLSFTSPLPEEKLWRAFEEDIKIL